MSTGNADEFPASVRPDRQRHGRLLSGGLSAEMSRQHPVNCREVAGKCPVHCPAKAVTHPR